MTALTLALVKSFLRYELDSVDQDVTLSVALEAGVEWVEAFTGHALRQRQFTQEVDRSGGYAHLDYWPVVGEPSLSLWQGDAEQTMQLRLFNGSRPATVRAASGWPSFDPMNPAKITYTAGYVDPETIPAGLLAGVLLYAGMFDRLRDGEPGDLLKPVEAICWQYRRITA